MPAGGDDGFQVVADLLPPVHENASALKLVEHAERDEAGLEGGEQFLPDIRHFPAFAELGEIVTGDLPPVLQRFAVAAEGFLNRRLALNQGLDRRLAIDGIHKCQITLAFRPEQGGALNSKFLPDC